MDKKVVPVITTFITLILIVIVVMLQDQSNMFDGMQPKAVYKGYKIYDLVEQRNLMCAEAIEILDSDANYDYYFNCLKSQSIYFVNAKEVMTVREAYARKIITKEELHSLGIVDRMERLKNE